jgi:hypothetical protein
MLWSGVEVASVKLVGGTDLKLVELEILKISYLGNFSSCYMILGVIGENSSNCKVWGESYSARRITAGQRTAWAPASRRATSRTFSRAPGPPARRRVPSSDRHCGRAYKYVELALNRFCFSIFGHRRR